MRILLVEDEAEVRRVFARALGSVAPNVQIVEASNGQEALLLFRDSAFDLVLSDHKMPLMTGLELLQTIRSGADDVPFLLITADRTIERDALAAGANELLSKPISLADLRKVVARYLRV